MKVNNYNIESSSLNFKADSSLVGKEKGKRKPSTIKTAKTPKGNRNYKLVPPYWIDVKSYRPTVSTHVDTFRDPQKIPKKL